MAEDPQATNFHGVHQRPPSSAAYDDGGDPEGGGFAMDFGDMIEGGGGGYDTSVNGYDGSAGVGGGYYMQGAADAGGYTGVDGVPFDGGYAQTMNASLGSPNPYYDDGRHLDVAGGGYAGANVTSATSSANRSPYMPYSPDSLASPNPPAAYDHPSSPPIQQVQDLGMAPLTKHPSSSAIIIPTGPEMPFTHAPPTNVGITGRSPPKQKNAAARNARHAANKLAASANHSTASLPPIASPEIAAVPLPVPTPNSPPIAPPPSATLPIAEVPPTGGQTFQVSAMNIMAAPPIAAVGIHFPPVPDAGLGILSENPAGGALHAPTPDFPAYATAGVDRTSSVTGPPYGGYTSAVPAAPLVDPKIDARTDVARVGYSLAPTPSGDATTTPVASHLMAQHEWSIPDFLSLTEDKIVSLPFGTRDWRWQMVLYPRGSPDSDRSHVSCFLRPLRSLEEVESGDAWKRPIENFTIKVFKGTSGGGIAERFGGYADPTAPKEVLVEDTSASSFTAFDASYPGWGFTYLLDLAYVNDAVDANGTLTVSAVVKADVLTEWTTYRLPWCLPSFDPTALDNGAEIVSPTFGPPENQWCIVLSRSEGVPGGVSGHLQPVLSEEETFLGGCWSRSVSSLTLKVRAGPADEDPAGSDGSVRYKVTKTLTGGFTFNATNMSTGWPSLLDTARTPLCLQADGSIIIEGEVTWDPSSLEREWGRGTRSWLVGRGREVASLRAEADAVAARVEEARAETADAVRRFEELSVRAAEERRVAGEERKAASERVRAETARAEALKVELEAAREAQARAGKLEAVLAGARARIAKACAGIAEGAVLVPAEGEEGIEPPGEEDAVGLRARLYAVQAELAKAREDLRLRVVTAVDASLAHPAPASGFDRRKLSSTPGPEDGAEAADRLPLARAMRNLEAELETARRAVAEANQRATELAAEAAGGAAASDPMSPPVPGAATDPAALVEAERAALRADLAMVYAEFEVARAAFIDSVAAEGHLHWGTETATVLLRLREEVAAFVNEFDRVKRGLLWDRYQFEDPVAPLPPVPVAPDVAELSFALEAERAERMRLEAELARSLQQAANGVAVAEDGPTALVVPPPPAAAAHLAPPSPESAAGLRERKKRPTTGIGALKIEPGAGSRTEAWTPVEGRGGFGGNGVDFEVLAEILKKLDSIPKARGSGFLSYTFSLLVLFLGLFVSYATLHVHCAQETVSGGVCTVLVPTYRSFASGIHLAAEAFVHDLVPHTHKAVESLSSSVVQGSRAVVGSVSKSLKESRDRAERARLERAEAEAVEARRAARAAEEAKKEAERKAEEARTAAKAAEEAREAARKDAETRAREAEEARKEAERQVKEAFEAVKRAEEQASSLKSKLEAEATPVVSAATLDLPPVTDAPPPTASPVSTASSSWSSLFESASTETESSVGSATPAVVSEEPVPPVLPGPGDESAVTVTTTTDLISVPTDVDGTSTEGLGSLSSTAVSTAADAEATTTPPSVDVDAPPVSADYDGIIPPAIIASPDSGAVAPPPLTEVSLTVTEQAATTDLSTPTAYVPPPALTPAIVDADAIASEDVAVPSVTVSETLLSESTPTTVVGGEVTGLDDADVYTSVSISATSATPATATEAPGVEAEGLGSFEFDDDLF
ncbi:hypothetical protein HDU96_010026 [Phlyctochytrium bullatum]|nr:hypothetical protein HDU96_010026 [Phlyctochytrium bullatum]